jgi:hypothetical protein
MKICVCMSVCVCLHMLYLSEMAQSDLLSNIQCLETFISCIWSFLTFHAVRTDSTAFNTTMLKTEMDVFLVKLSWKKFSVFLLPVSTIFYPFGSLHWLQRYIHMKCLLRPAKHFHV